MSSPGALWAGSGSKIGLSMGSRQCGGQGSLRWRGAAHGGQQRWFARWRRPLRDVWRRPGSPEEKIEAAAAECLGEREKGAHK